MRVTTESSGVQPARPRDEASKASAQGRFRGLGPTPTQPGAAPSPNRPQEVCSLQSLNQRRLRPKALGPTKVPSSAQH